MGGKEKMIQFSFIACVRMYDLEVGRKHDLD